MGDVSMREPLSTQDTNALAAARFELSDQARPLPPVGRIRFTGLGAPLVSALKWQQDAPLLVLLHGGFENAHVWDLLSLELDQPLIALDLPGCGMSARIEDGTYWPPNTNRLLSHVLHEFASRPVALVGLSYGGLVALSLLANVPDCISQVILLDVLPGAAPAHAERVIQWLQQRPKQPSLEELEELWAGLYPNRSARFLSEQILSAHTRQAEGLVPNADLRPERWNPIPGFDHLWRTVERSDKPLSLLRAGRSRVVSDDHVDRLCELRPDAAVHTMSDSRHHIPLHAPRELASILRELTSLAAA